MRDERDIVLQAACPGKAAAVTTEPGAVLVTLAGAVVLRVHDDHGYVDFEVRPAVSPEVER